MIYNIDINLFDIVYSFFKPLDWGFIFIGITLSVVVVISTIFIFEGRAGYDTSGIIKPVMPGPSRPPVNQPNTDTNGQDKPKDSDSTGKEKPKVPKGSKKRTPTQAFGEDNSPSPKAKR